VTADKVARIERLQAGTMRNCSDQRRNDTRGFIADSLTRERELVETINEQDDRIDGLRKALDKRNEMMDNEADRRDKEAKRLQYRVDQARENEELASDEIILLNEVVICQAKHITQLVEDAK